MKAVSFDKDEYKSIPILKMIDNAHGDLPFFIRLYSAANMTTSFHRHEYMQINYVNKGSGKHVLNGHEFDIVKGDIFVIPPYIPHCIKEDSGNAIDIFEFEFLPEFINQNFNKIDNAEAFLDFAYIEPFLVSENKVKPRLNITGKIQIEVENILNEALKEYTDRNTGFLLLVKSLLLKLLVIVGREFNKEVIDKDSQSVYIRYKESIYESIKYIEENYHRNISVEEIAKRAALSRSYFSYLFKSITSKTFTEYLNSLRITGAMELLKNTDDRVIDICYQAGFNNVNHFNRMFRQKTGISPRIYRKTDASESGSNQ